jgi:hypothetical protein
MLHLTRFPERIFCYRFVQAATSVLSDMLFSNMSAFALIDVRCEECPENRTEAGPSMNHQTDMTCNSSCSPVLGYEPQAHNTATTPLQKRTTMWIMLNNRSNSSVPSAHHPSSLPPASAVFAHTFLCSRKKAWEGKGRTEKNTDGSQND